MCSCFISSCVFAKIHIFHLARISLNEIISKTSDYNNDIVLTGVRSTGHLELPVASMAFLMSDGVIRPTIHPSQTPLHASSLEMPPG